MSKQLDKDLIDVDTQNALTDVLIASMRRGADPTQVFASFLAVTIGIAEGAGATKEDIIKAIDLLI